MKKMQFRMKMLTKHKLVNSKLSQLMNKLMLFKVSSQLAGNLSPTD